MKVVIRSKQKIYTVCRAVLDFLSSSTKSPYWTDIMENDLVMAFDAAGVLQDIKSDMDFLNFIEYEFKEKPIFE